MPKYSFKQETYHSPQLKTDILKAFSSLQRFAQGVDLEYDIVYRVVNLKPCTREEINWVVDAMEAVDPEVILPLVEELKPESVTKQDLEKIHRALIDLYSALSKK